MKLRTILFSGFPFLAIIFAVAVAQGQQVVVYTTAKDSNFNISQTADLIMKDYGQPPETQICVFIDPTKKYQTILGFGGALTDASAETFYKLPKKTQQQLLKAYFGKDGLGYLLGRTNIGSCDFSSGSYSYIQEGDSALKSFSVKHDQRYKIPFIKEVMAEVGKDFFLYASPWSPPAFMKSNHDVLHGGFLLPEYYDSWARYYVKFIKAYENVGIPVWGISIQNEPMATQVWESCIYTAEQERDFLKNHLGPVMRSSGLQSKKIIGWDHNRDLLYQRASVLLEDKEAAAYLWGIGFHWYEPWSGGVEMFDNVRLVHDAFPKTNLIFTEGSAERFDSAKIHAWSLGEKYGNNMLNDLNNGIVAWTDWNILLDERGGPNHAGNFCFAPVLANTRTGELIFTNAYDYIGHFSKFIRKGARRITASASRSQLQATSFVNTDGSIATVVLNLTGHTADYILWMHGKAVETRIPAHAIQTLVLKS